MSIKGQSSSQISMEVPWQNLFDDIEMEDDGGDFFNPHHNNSMVDEELFLGEILQQSTTLSSESENHSTTTTQNNSCSTLSFDDTNLLILNNKDGKQLLTKSNSSNSIASEHVPKKHVTTSPCILSFDNSTVMVPTHNEACGGRKQQGEACSSKGSHQYSSSTRKTRRSSSESLDHIMAERKRRKELTERFIALSATIPGLKKIDKATILSEAITYVKQLQNRVKELEEQSSKKIKIESVSSTNEGTASCKTKNSNDYDYIGFNVEFPEVEARVLETHVLIRIHCKKQKGIMVKIFTHLRSLDISIVSSGVLPFGNSALDVAIIAQMGDSDASVKDVVKSLRLVLLESPDKQL